MATSCQPSCHLPSTPQSLSLCRVSCCLWHLSPLHAHSLELALHDKEPVHIIGRPALCIGDFPSITGTHTYPCVSRPNGD
ncbi:hypothetical protein GOODEAATRI_005883 [Goodea atripinnis]|uniref:Secreted protein n=1 Tax=Goodea atripinnis TaxID=208336 RepID=A0ABV0PL87_9TELE